MRQSCHIDARRCVRINFNLLNERSQLATDTCIFIRMCRATPRLGNTSSSYETMNESSYSGVVGPLSWRVLEGSTAEWSAHGRGVS